jgi:hypothetical protein
VNIPSLSDTDRSLEADSLAGIVRYVRKICLLREQQSVEEAAKLEKTDFANAVRDFRLAHGADNLPEARLRQLFEAEEQRVAEAVILSELIIPQLVKSFPVFSGPTLPNSAPASSPERTPVPVRPPSDGVPQIADLLDGMLASDRNNRRQRTGT